MQGYEVSFKYRTITTINDTKGNCKNCTIGIWVKYSILESNIKMVKAYY